MAGLLHFTKPGEILALSAQRFTYCCQLNRQSARSVFSRSKQSHMFRPKSWARYKSKTLLIIIHHNANLLVIADNHKYFNEEIKILSTLHFNNTADMNQSSDGQLVILGAIYKTHNNS